MNPLKPNPDVILLYTCVAGRVETDGYARHFAQTYRLYPPGFKHRLVVLCNGGALPQYVRRMFEDTPAEFFVRSNDGFDIGGYLEYAGNTQADLLVCLGESVYFRRPNWLYLIVGAYMEHGDGMYGCLASYRVRPHLLTTAFAVTPRLLRTYDRPVMTKPQRYAFEHGPESFWRRIRGEGYPVKLVTWDGVYDPPQWRSPANILWRGDQSNCLVWCNHMDRFFALDAKSKFKWAAEADCLK